VPIRGVKATHLEVILKSKENRKKKRKGKKVKKLDKSLDPSNQ
jgi:hypothetical protein